MRKSQFTESQIVAVPPPRFASPSNPEPLVRTLERLFANNRVWAAAMTREDPEFFRRLAAQQAPRYLWIGCSDSRVPANQIVGLPPGEMFVHRNVANLVRPDDINALAVIEFAVETLGVADLIVCGHEGCGGVRAALSGEAEGRVGRWLEPVRELSRRFARELAPLESEAARHRRLCELNVIEQVDRVCRTGVVRTAWRSGRALAVHGWIYDIGDGLLRDLGACVTSEAEQDEVLAAARARGAPG